MKTLNESTDTLVARKIKRLEEFLTQEGLEVDVFHNQLYVYVQSDKKRWQFQVQGGAIPRMCAEEKLILCNDFGHVD